VVDVDVLADGEEDAVLDASFVGTMDGLASMMIVRVRVLVVVLPQVSVATYATILAHRGR
jgi:hypothetical protein